MTTSKQFFSTRKSSYFIISLFFLTKTCQSVKPSDNQDDYNIITNITTGYQKLVRPNSTLDITIKLSLKTISAIDEKNLVMTSDSYFTGIQFLLSKIFFKDIQWCNLVDKTRS
jgi:hypothetical protein